MKIFAAIMLLAVAVLAQHGAQENIVKLFSEPATGCFLARAPELAQMGAAYEIDNSVGRAARESNVEFLWSVGVPSVRYPQSVGCRGFGPTLRMAAIRAYHNCIANDGRVGEWGNITAGGSPFTDDQVRDHAKLEAQRKANRENYFAIFSQVLTDQNAKCDLEDGSKSNGQAEPPPSPAATNSVAQ